MKKLIIFSALLVLVGVFADSAYQVTVTTNSTMVVPYADASSYSFSSWATGTTYDQGDYVRVGTARYWTPDGGTSTNQPAHLEGATEYLDGVTWVRITNNDRRVAVVSNLGAYVIWLSFGSADAVVSNGVPLYQYERYMYEGQKEIRATVGSGTTVVSCSDEDES